ncbi:MAG: hypothetical protein DAHOPDDO_00168 [Ignavibacteriaceae bacterium]|nr:hypothetical protein [Ignavibacteriaceae bacterium]
MTLDYNEELHHKLERNIILEPNIGTLVWNDTSEYKYFAPSSTPGDTALIVRIYYEQFHWGCAYGELKPDSIKTNSTLEDYQCGCPIWTWTQVFRKYGIDSIMIAWDSLDVKVMPDTIYPGDTAQVVIKKRLPDGTLTDFDSTQTYEVGMLDGCILGKIQTSSDSGSYVYNVTQPIYFIADTSADTTGVVLLRVGLVEQTNKPENKNNQQSDIAESDCFIGWQSNSYDDVTEFVDNPLEIIYPNPLSTMWILAEPQMPIINCSAVYKKYHLGAIKYEWKFTIKMTYQRRESDYGPPICERISKSEFNGLSYSDLIHLTTWAVPFEKDSGYFYFKSLQQDKNKYDPLNYLYGCSGEDNNWYDENDEIFTGGEVFITLKAKDYQSGEILAELVEVPSGKILGENPGPQAIYDSANENEIKALIWKESRSLRQFTFQENPNQQWPYDGDGWPLYGEPNGYGLMQIDNNPAAKERQLWNWKANIDAGRTKFHNVKDGYTDMNGYYMKGTDDILDAHPDNDTEAMRLKCAFQKYNDPGYERKTKIEHYFYKWNGIAWEEDEYFKKERVEGEPGLKKYGEWVYDKYLEY